MINSGIGYLNDINHSCESCGSSEYNETSVSGNSLQILCNNCMSVEFVDVPHPDGTVEVKQPSRQAQDRMKAEYVRMKQNGDFEKITEI